MPPKRIVGVTSSTDPQSLTWLTFLNSSCLDEQTIRAEFVQFGEVAECDGAIGGPEDGWVMVAMVTRQEAETAMETLKGNNESKVGATLQMINLGGAEEEEMETEEAKFCLRCARKNHMESTCKARDKTCSKCGEGGKNQVLAVGHFEGVHDIEDSNIRKKVIKLLGAEMFMDWEEAREGEKLETFPKPVPAEKTDVVVRTKKVEKLERVEQDLLSKGVENIAVGGLAQFHQTNSKILEMVTMNNTMLLERVREVEENCLKQIKEKDDQIKRLQNLLSNKDDHMRKLTNRLNSATDFEGKVKKFFGENEDFHKKKVVELSKANTELVSKLEESEARRMDKLLEEADSSKIRETVTSLSTITEDIQSKTEQVWAVVQGLDSGAVVVGAGGDEKGKETVSSTVGLLHNKVDKMVRLMVETSENQKKMNKVLQDLLKVGFVKSEVAAGGAEDGEGEKRKRRKEREKSRERGDSRDKRSRSPDSSLEPAVTTMPHQIDHEFEEMKWGLNMALIGDGHWKSFNIVEDIHNIVTRMEKKVNLRVMGKEGETLSRMYDDQRECLISALPTRCYKVGISVGTYDLKDNSLITLKEASMEEVRRRNEPKLVNKATSLRDLVVRLISQNKSVVVMIPPHGEERIELHHHWEEILLATLKDVRFPKLRILNMAQVMRSTMSEFRNNDDYLDMWLSPTPKPRRYLSAYGTRRMFYALRQTITAKSPQAAGMAGWPECGQSNNLALPSPAVGAPVAACIPNPADFPCPRCTRHHPGGQDKCKSIDKLCRKCNNVGHFTEVHDITDPMYRQLIVNTLGINLWGDWEMKANSAEHQPEAKRGRMEGPAMAENVDRRQLSLEKLSEMERRMGLKEDIRGGMAQGGRGRGGGNWY